MKTINRSLEAVRNQVRGVMNHLASGLNRLTGGRLDPNLVTVFGFAMHVPIAVLIAMGEPRLAGLGLIVFGLFDSLDGALARLQNRSSRLGMLLDSVTDRMKEAIIYIGIAYALVAQGHVYWAVWAVAACGAGLVVSYINAWGEVVTKDLPKEATNKAFRGGVMSFDIRMACLAFGLLFNLLIPILIIVTVLAWITALERLKRISRFLQDAES